MSDGGNGRCASLGYPHDRSGSQAAVGDDASNVRYWGYPDVTLTEGRLDDPEDVALMAAFLAGPGGRNITGQTINIDGGLVMN